MSQYPEHEKLKEVKAAVDIVATFLEWVESQGMFLASYHEHTPECCGGKECGYYSDSIVPERRGIEAILADHFEIDLKKLDRENEQMLQEIREANGRM